MPEQRPVQWAPAADRDLSRIREYLEPKNPKAFRGLVRRLLEASDRIASFPESGARFESKRTDSGELRVVTVPPYRLFYRLDGRAIAILRCWDSRRNPDDLSIPGDDDEPDAAAYAEADVPPR